MGYAIANGDYELLRILLGSAQRTKGHAFDLHKFGILDAVETLPDLEFELHLNCKSFIPFVGSFAPSDVYKVLSCASLIVVQKRQFRES